MAAPFDAHKNFSYGTVLTAPSPPASGTTLVLGSGQGAEFPDPSVDGEYNVTVWPTATQPLSSNSEIVRVTARSTDTLTITRQQEGSSARTILVGDQVAMTITKKIVTDLENASGNAMVRNELLTTGIQQNTFSLDLERSSNQYAAISDGSQTGLDFATRFTLQTWVKIETQALTDTNHQLISKDDVGAGQRSFTLLYRDQSGTKRFKASVQDSIGNSDGYRWDYTLPVGIWVHVALTCDVSQPSATTFELFIDGVSQGNGTADTANNISAIFNSTAAFTLASRSDAPVDTWDGLLDNVLAFDDVRTPAEIISDMTTQSITDANLQGHWKLNDDYTDSSGNGNTLTPSGGPVFVTDVPFTETQFTLANTPLTDSLRLYLNGVRQEEGAGNDFTLSGDIVTMIATPLSIDKLVADYEINSGTFATGSSSFVYGEQVNETPTGSLAVFTVDNAYIAGSTQVYVDGQLQQRGAGNDYTESTPSTGEITFTYNPASGSIILVTYQQSVSTAGNADTVDGFNANATPTANQIPVLDGSAQFPQANISNTAKSSAYMGSSQLNLTSGSATKVVFDTENYDPGSNYDPATNYRFTAPVDGYYLIDARITWLGSSVVLDKRYTMFIYKNGASVAWTFNHASLVTALSSQITEILSLSATNYIEIFARQDSGVNTVDLDGGSAPLSTFDVHLLSV